MSVTDSIAEGNESFTLSAATARNVGAVVGTGTITDGSLPVVSISNLRQSMKLRVPSYINFLLRSEHGASGR